MILNIGQLNAQTQGYSNSLNSYSFDLYRGTKVEKENLFLSPLSTYYALLVAYEGSKNKTKQEFEKVLYLKNSGSLGNDYLHDIASKSDSCSGLKVSNAIWLDKSLKAEEQYRKSVSDKYFSDFEQTDFKKIQSAISDINDWVSEKTNQKVNKIACAANINPDTKLLISNAVYFKGEWLDKFKKRDTHFATFFVSIEDQYKVDFMEKKEILQYFENEEYQFISKPYKSSDMSFCILLPKKLFGIKDIEKKMCNDFFDKILDSTYYAKTLLYIPKFKMELGYELANTLKNVGLKSAFSNEADFSGITKEEPVILGQVLHKTWIELDEEKTEAAAVTTAIGIVGAATLDAFKVFNADHPFVFFILDNSNRAILFMGRYVIPTQGEKIVEDKENLAIKVEYRKGDTFYRGNQDRKILYVVNNKIVSQTEFKAINPKEIETVNVFNETEEVRKYSSGDYIGLVKVSLKKEENKKIGKL
jgi:serpin B